MNLISLLFWIICLLLTGIANSAAQSLAQQSFVYEAPSPIFPSTYYNNVQFDEEYSIYLAEITLLRQAITQYEEFGSEGLLEFIEGKQSTVGLFSQEFQVLFQPRTIVEFSESQSTSCPSGYGYGECLVGENESTVYPLPPLEVASASAVSRAYSNEERIFYFGDRSQFIWAPVDENSDWSKIVERIREQAEGRSVFDCDLDSCLTIISRKFYGHDGQLDEYGEEVIAANNRVIERLSVCSVEVIEDDYSAPRFCNDLLISTASQTFLNAIIGPASPRGVRPGVYYSNLGPNNAGGFYFLARESDTETYEILNVVERALRKAPLSLSTKVKRSRVTGASSHRASKIIRGFELLTFHMWVTDLPSEGYWDGPEFDRTGYTVTEVEVSPTIYVNRQNTSTASDWRMPNSSQMSAFFTALYDQIWKEIQAECGTPRTLDSRTVLCN